MAEVKEKIAIEHRVWTGLVDKSDWAEGEWQNEQDAELWIDEKTKLPCLIRRNPAFGHLCGYVAVTEEHPLYKQYSTLNQPEISVHGGVTPTGSALSPLPVKIPELEGVWWFGFECDHPPDMAPYYSSLLLSLIEDDMIYRNIKYVKNECRKLAAQLGEQKGITADD